MSNSRLKQPEKGQIWTKFCGLTKDADVQAAQACGAHAIGLNFVPASPRFLDLETAKLLSHGATVACVGLFADADRAAVQQVLQHCRIDLLQFHGDEDPSFCRSFGMPYMKALRVHPELDISAEIAKYTDAWAVLLDAFVPGIQGGTGKQFDWQLWPTSVDTPLVVAGGLSPENVADAVQQCRPFGVDVSGGVEAVSRKVFS